MLGDCYAAAIVECLSKNELMACDALSFCRENSSFNSNDKMDPNEMDKKDYMPELIVVELSEANKDKNQTYSI